MISVLSTELLGKVDCMVTSAWVHMEQSHLLSLAIVGVVTIVKAVTSESHLQSTCLVEFCMDYNGRCVTIKARAVKG